MSVTKSEEIKRTKIFETEHFRYRLSEKKEDEWVKKSEKSPGKVEKSIRQHVQKSMRQTTDKIVEGHVWEDAYEELANEVINLVENR